MASKQHKGKGGWGKIKRKPSLSRLMHQNVKSSQSFMAAVTAATTAAAEAVMQS